MLVPTRLASDVANGANPEHWGYFKQRLLKLGGK